MRDGALPAVALCLSLGLLLAASPLRRWLIAASLTSVAAIAVGAFVLPIDWLAPIVIGCWSVAGVFALGVFPGRRLALVATLLAGAIAGVLTGALTGESARPGVLLAALPCLLVRLPAAWLVARNRAIIVKILASWLLAIAVLSAGLTATAGVNAGADHLE